jgi:hypothetical protein
MEGIQFIVNDSGQKTAVVIDLEKWGNLWQDFYQLMLEKSNVNNQQNEEWLKQSNLEEKLDQALEWNVNHPPQVSDLEVLKQQLNLENNSAYKK